MGSTGFDLLAQQGIANAGRKSAERQSLKEQEFLQQNNDLLSQRDALQQKLGTLKDATGKPLPGYDETLSALQQNVQAIREHWHPEKNPGMIQKFGHILTHALGITKPQGTETMAVPNPQGLKEPGNLPIWNRPVVQNDDGSHSSEYSTSFQDPKTGFEVLIPTVVNGKFMTPDGKKPKEGSPEEKAMFQEAWKHYLETGENLGKFATPQDADAYAQVLHNRGHVSKTIAKKEAQTEQQKAANKKTAEGLAAATPLSPAQTSAQQTQAELAAKQAVMDWTIDWAKKNNISGPDLDQLQRHLVGLTVSKLVPLGKVYKSTADGKYYQPMRDPDTNEITDQPMPPDYQPPTTGAPIRAWARDASGKIYSMLLDRNTNKPIEGSVNYDILPPPYLTTKISTGMYHWVDEDNQIHETPESRTTQPVLPPMGGGAGARQPAPSGAQPSAGAAASGGSTPATPKTPTRAKPVVPDKAQIKDRILGYKGSAPLNHARQMLSDSVRISSLADKLQKKAETSPDDMSEADAQFVLSLIRSEAGRVNQQEIAQLFNAGGIAEMPERWAAKAGHGQLSENLRNQLVEFTHNTKEAAQDAVDALTHDPAKLLNEANKKLYPDAPDIGTVEPGEDNKNHQYKGGDPGNPASWPVVNQQ